MNQPSMNENRSKDEPSSRRADHRHGAPRERGPGGLLRRVRAQMGSPSVLVWKGPVLRSLTMAAVVSCLAFVGARAKNEEAYGPRIQVELAERPAPVEPESPAAHAHTDEAPTQRPCVDEKKAPKSTGVLPDGRIVLNEATEQDFTRLPGVGESRAKAIVELRQRLGKFRKVSDLLRVKGIGWKTLQRLKELVVLERPPEESEQTSAPNHEDQAADKGPAPTGPASDDS